MAEPGGMKEGIQHEQSAVGVTPERTPLRITGRKAFCPRDNCVQQQLTKLMAASAFAAMRLSDQSIRRIIGWGVVVITRHHIKGQMGVVTHRDQHWRRAAAQLLSRGSVKCAIAALPSSSQSTG